MSDNGTVTTRTYIGSLYEKEAIAGGLTIHHHYVRAGSQTVSIVKSKSDSTEEYLYLHRDHLGSVTYITDASGGLVEELSYDPHGKRRFVTDWLDATATQVVAVSTKHGFTGHEMLDDVGLVHMGGRVYDPTLGRFLSADPHVQSIQNPQALNRYSYVLNNPLSMTDPSGFFFKGLFKAVGKLFSKVFKNKIVRTVAAIVAYYFGGPIAGAFASGLISSGGDLKEGLISVFVSVATIGLAPPGPFLSAGHLKNIVARAAIGAAVSVVRGGKAVKGALSSAASAFFGPITGDNIVAVAIVGGVVAEIGGGKFANGAITGAFTYVAYHAVRGAANSQGGNRGSQETGRSAGSAFAAEFGIALESINPSGGMWDYLFGGRSINRRLEAFSRVYAGKSVNIDEIRLDLAIAHASAVSEDVSGLPGLLNPEQIAEYHHVVFNKYNLPSTAFGGTPFTGSVSEANFTTVFWCRRCDWNYGDSALFIDAPHGLSYLMLPCPVFRDLSYPESRIM